MQGICTTFFPQVGRGKCGKCVTLPGEYFFLGRKAMETCPGSNRAVRGCTTAHRSPYSHFSLGWCSMTMRNIITLILICVLSYQCFGGFTALVPLAVALCLPNKTCLCWWQLTSKHIHVPFASFLVYLISSTTLDSLLVSSVLCLHFRPSVAVCAYTRQMYCCRASG